MQVKPSKSVDMIRGYTSRHDVLRAHQVLEIGRADGAVLNAVAQSFTGILPLGRGHGVQRLLDGAVPDGVDGAVEALPMCTAEERI